MSLNLDDEVLQMYLTESKEHLEHIENDLLTIEEQGSDLDDELINHVFRAIHTIKGAAGFFGFTKVKELTHYMEHLLDLMRKRQCVPTPENVSVLLEGADVLREMIHHPEQSEDMDIEQLVQSISVFVNGESGETTEEREVMEVKSPDGKVVFELSALDLERALQDGHGGNIYMVQYDLLTDIEEKGKIPVDVIFELQQLCFFIDSKLDATAIGELSESDSPFVMPFYALLSTPMEYDLICHFLELPPERVIALDKKEIEQSLNLPKKSKKAKAPAPAPSVEELPTLKAESEPSAKTERAAKSPAKPTQPKQETTKSKQSKVSKTTTPETSLRVNMRTVDSLMTLAGELVLVRNQLVQSVGTGELEEIEKAVQKADLITSDLQETIMSTRMQSVGTVLKKFNRIVRDLSRSLNKKIRLEIEGEDVELDRQIIEGIGDPLTHLVRNACDHGIEQPEKREAMGKDPVGTLKLHAYHEAGQVNIDIIDNGGGINTERVKTKAVEMGIITEAESSRLSTREAAMLIFKPGFSTADQITEVSGRGVGMDVVYTNLASMGGVVDIETEAGKGTVFRIKLPLTMAIIPSLLISVEHEHYAIPQINLVELVRVPAAEVKYRMEKIGNATVLRMRGELLPLVRLRDCFNMDGTYLNPETGERIPDRRQRLADRRTAADQEDRGPDRRTSIDSALNVAVVSSGNFHFGLVVDELLDSSEIVVKPLGYHLSKCQIYAGATILGNGKVAPILDVTGISKDQGLREVSEDPKKQEQTSTEVKSDHETFLLVTNTDEIFAIPLGLVARIETMPRAKIEIVGGRPSIKYRNSSMVLFSIDEVAEVSAPPQTDDMSVVVFQAQGREVGLQVGEVLDIIESTVDIDTVTHRQPGIFGSALINDRITLFLDLYGIVAARAPAWLETVENSEKQFTILVVEDSPFFREQIKTFIVEIGHKVITAENGLEGLQAAKSRDLDLIITDIEMPVMDGFQMVSEVRELEKCQDTPIIAVTSLATPEAKEKGLAVGIDEYLIKLDKGMIQRQIQRLLEHGRTANIAMEES